MNSDAPVVDSPVSVKDLRPGEDVLQYFEVRSKETRKTRSGQDYVDIVLGDATGSIEAKMWSDVVRKWGHEFSPGDFVKVEGRVELYKERNQLVIEKIRRAELSEVPEPERLVRSPQQDPDDLFDELLRISATLKPPDLAGLVSDVLHKHGRSLKTVPAAKLVHHAYRGGLVEHTVSVTRKVNAVLELEGNIDRNIAVAGAILHDIGKVLELTPMGCGRTLEGRLIGHVILGRDLLRDAARERGCSDASWVPELEHIVLSHHGESAFGAPVRPLTREALLVHFIDNLDAKLKIMSEALEAVDAEGFTPYNKWLEGRVFAGARSLPEEEDNDRDSRETS